MSLKAEISSNPADAAIVEHVIWVDGIKRPTLSDRTQDEVLYIGPTSPPQLVERQSEKEA